MKKYYSYYANKLFICFIFYGSYKYYMNMLDETWLKNDLKDLYKETNLAFITRNKVDNFYKLFKEIEFNRD